MSTIFTNIISSEELEAILPANPLILDCRHQLGDPAWGYQQFQAGHIAGSQHADMDQHLAAPPGPGGRHPLPDRATWIEQLRAWGLKQDQQVVVYDDAGGAFAARAWWMLRWVGHEAVAVLDGGLGQWHQPLVSGPAEPPIRGEFKERPSLVEVCTVDQIRAHIAAKPTSGTLIDARTNARWAGAEEPIDPVAGHIPTSLCFPLQGNLASDGTFLDSTALAARFESIPDPVICYCGSGVTACHNILALHIAGRAAALFVDSWSGWITNSANPIGHGVAAADT